MRSALPERLREGVVLLDGAMGTALMARGLAAGTPPEAWNLERPGDVRAVHAGYVHAGSVVVQTNTFGANPVALERHGLAGRMADVNRRAVDLAREAAGPERLVAGSMGPTGSLLTPLGDATQAGLTEAFARQAAALAEAGADYLAVETMMDLAEALCALRGARQATGLPVTVCLTFERRRRGFFTLMGNRPADCARALAAAGAVAVGANCSVGSDEMVELCAEFADASELPVVVKPNAGLPELADGRPVYRQAAGDFARDMVAVVEAGARAVGGCCGTDHTFIAALARALADARAGGATGPEATG